MSPTSSRDAVAAYATNDCTRQPPTVTSPVRLRPQPTTHEGRDIGPAPLRLSVPPSLLSSHSFTPAIHHNDLADSHDPAADLGATLMDFRQNSAPSLRIRTRPLPVPTRSPRLGAPQPDREQRSTAADTRACGPTAGALRLRSPGKADGALRSRLLLPRSDIPAAKGRVSQRQPPIARHGHGAPAPTLEVALGTSWRSGESHIGSNA